MLVLSRKRNESIVIGDSITVTVVEVKGNRIRLAISAPSDVRILRGELDPLFESLDNCPRPLSPTAV